MREDAGGLLPLDLPLLVLDTACLPMSKVKSRHHGLRLERVEEEDGKAATLMRPARAKAASPTPKEASKEEPDQSGEHRQGCGAYLSQNGYCRFNVYGAFLH